MGKSERAERRDNMTLNIIDVALSQLSNRLDSKLQKVQDSFMKRDDLLQTLVGMVQTHGESLQGLTDVTSTLKKARTMASRGPNIPISEYDGANTADFIPWLNDFKRKFAANNWPSDRKAATLAGYLAGHAKIVYHSPEETDSSDYQKLTNALKGKLRAQDRERFIRQRFESLAERQGLTVLDYSVTLNGLAETALAFITNKVQRDTALRERFMAGLQPYLKEQLSIMGPKTFQEALVAAERVESARMVTHPTREERHYERTG